MFIKGPRKTRVYDVHRDDNTIYISSSNFDVFLSVQGIDLPPKLDLSFATWIALPDAMTRGANLRLEVPVDPVVIDNARHLSYIWSLWMPERFQFIDVESDGDWSTTTYRGVRPIHLYSGGVDSTYSLIRIGRRSVGGKVLSVLGLDYPLERQSQFMDMVRKTDTLLKTLNLERIIIKTNVAQYVKTLSINHGFILAGCAFLLRNIFSKAQIAADYTHAQDMMVFPWGTNHVTNAYFAGTDFLLETLCGDVSRTEKVGALARDQIALSSLTFCGKRAYRPANCGICNKCVRTKAMFIAMTGTFPSVFTDMSFTKALIGNLDLNDRKDYTFFAELWQQAIRNGYEEYFPGMNELLTEARGKIVR